jgi:hypothetical protein
VSPIGEVESIAYSVDCLTSGRGRCLEATIFDAARARAFCITD